MAGWCGLRTVFPDWALHNRAHETVSCLPAWLSSNHGRFPIKLNPWRIYQGRWMSCALQKSKFPAFFVGSVGVQIWSWLGAIHSTLRRSLPLPQLLGSGTSVRTGEEFLEGAQVVDYRHWTVTRLYISRRLALPACTSCFFALEYPVAATRALPLFLMIPSTGNTLVRIPRTSRLRSSRPEPHKPTRNARNARHASAHNYGWGMSRACRLNNINASLFFLFLFHRRGTIQVAYTSKFAVDLTWRIFLLFSLRWTWLGAFSCFSVCDGIDLAHFLAFLTLTDMWDTTVCRSRRRRQVSLASIICTTRCDEEGR
jgi:hypothetical protein